MTEGRGEDFSVDLVMESRGMVTNEGYTVEVAIPFKSLRYEAGRVRSGVPTSSGRIKRFQNELDMWMPIDRNKTNWLRQAGHITGLEEFSTERTLEIILTLTASETGKRVRTLATPAPLGMIDPGRFVRQPIKVDQGVSIKYGVTSTVTFDLALNPDFAQVEADAMVLTANQRFTILFQAGFSL